MRKRALADKMPKADYQQKLQFQEDKAYVDSYGSPVCFAGQTKVWFLLGNFITVDQVPLGLCSIGFCTEPVIYSLPLHLAVRRQLSRKAAGSIEGGR